MGVSAVRHSAFPTFVVSTPGYDVHFEVSLPNCQRSATLRLDFSVVLKETSRSPDGLLGSTRNAASGKLRDPELVTEFLVESSDMFGTDFARYKYVRVEPDMVSEVAERSVADVNRRQRGRKAMGWLDVVMRGH